MPLIQSSDEGTDLETKRNIPLNGGRRKCVKKGRGLGAEVGRRKEGSSVKGKSGERGSETSEKGLESWFRSETDSSNKE